MQCLCLGPSPRTRRSSHAGGGPKYEGEHTVPPPQDTGALTDPWANHVVHCKECQQVWLSGLGPDHVSTVARLLPQDLP